MFLKGLIDWAGNLETYLSPKRSGCWRFSRWQTLSMQSLQNKHVKQTNRKKVNENKNHRPVDSAESTFTVKDRLARHLVVMMMMMMMMVVITNTDLLATWTFKCFNLSFAWDEMIVERNCNYWHCTAGETSWSWTLETASSSSTNSLKLAFFFFDPWLSQHFIWGGWYTRYKELVH